MSAFQRFNPKFWEPWKVATLVGTIASYTTSFLTGYWAHNGGTKGLVVAMTPMALGFLATFFWMVES